MLDIARIKEVPLNEILLADRFQDVHEHHHFGSDIVKQVGEIRSA